MGVYKRKSGRYEARVDTPRDAAGNRKRRSLGTFRTRKEAEAAERDALQSLDRGIDLSPRDVTLAQIMTRYLDDREHRCSAKTVERYHELERLYIVPHLGALTLARLRPAHVSEWISLLMKRGGKDGRALSPRSVRHAHSLLKEAIGWAVGLQLAVTNAAAVVKAPSVQRSEVRALSPEEVDALLAAAATSRWVNLIAVALCTGARRGELAALRWSAIDLEGGMATIREALSQTNAGVSVKSTKTDRVRTIPLSPLAIEALRRQRVRQAQEKLAAGGAYDDRGYVFANALGARPIPFTMTDAFREFARKAGIEGVSFHALRHTAATWMISGGVDARSAADILGHSTPATTLSIYSHAIASVKIAAVTAIDERLASRKR